MKRKTQDIQLVKELGPLWESEEPETDVQIHRKIGRASNTTPHPYVGELF